jgi:chromosome segregation ATPase
MRAGKGSAGRALVGGLGGGGGGGGVVSKGEELRKQIDELTQRVALEKKAREEASHQTQTVLASLKQSLDIAIDEQRRLMTVGDEFKQQAARERALRTKVEASHEKLASESAELKKQLALLTHQRGVLEGTAAAQTVQIETLMAQLAQVVRPQPLRPKTKFRPGVKTKR